MIIPLLLPLVAGSVDVYEGDTITVEAANVSVIFGQNYTFNTSAAELHGFDTTNTSVIPLGAGQNLSITSDTPQQVNATLWQYNLSGALWVGKPLVTLEVAAVPDSTVDVTLTGFPSPGDNRFVVAAGDTHLKDVPRDGTVTWSHDVQSPRNFTITYQEVSDADSGPSDGSSSGSSGGVFAGQTRFCSTENPSDDYSWLGADRDRYTFNEIGLSGLKSVDVELTVNASAFTICVERLPDRPNGTATPANVYHYYDLHTEDHDGDVTQTTVRVTVNRSFAQQYDRIVLSQYDETWQDLPTNRTDMSETTATYEATATEPSYFAVRGTDTSPVDDPGRETGNQSTPSDLVNETTAPEPTRNETSPPGQEPATTDPAEGENQSRATAPGTQDQPVGPGLLPIIGGLGVLTVLGLGSWYGYRHWPTRTGQTAGTDAASSAETDLPTLFTEINRLIDKKGVRHTDFVETKLNQAEYARAHDLPEVARTRLQEIKAHLQQD